MSDSLTPEEDERLQQYAARLKQGLGLGQKEYVDFYNLARKMKPLVKPRRD